MWEFNLVVTMASGGRFHHLMEELELYGEFRKTQFLGVVLGRVEDPWSFLETVREHRERQLSAFQDLGRVVPIERHFIFRAEEFVAKACEAIRPWVGQLAGRRFYVRLERRGLKGRIISPEAERAIDVFIKEELGQRGQQAAIDFSDPDVVVTIETIGDRAGLALLTRALRERFDFVRVA